MKKLLFVLFVVAPGRIFAFSMTEAPFGFSQSVINQEAEKMPEITRAVRLKRAAIIGSFTAAAGFYIYRTWNKFMYSCPPGQIIFAEKDGQEMIYRLVTDPRVFEQAATWGGWCAEMVKNLGETAGQLCIGSLFSYYGAGLLKKYCVTINLDWFMSQYTHLQDPEKRHLFVRVGPDTQYVTSEGEAFAPISEEQFQYVARQDLFERIIKDVQMLPLNTDAKDISLQRALIHSKIELLIGQIMKIIGYLQFQQSNALDKATFDAVIMRQIIDRIKLLTSSFCVSLDTLLQAKSLENGTVRGVSETALQIENRMKEFSKQLYAHLHSFSLCEQHCN